jgi:hypothetical protein
VSAKPSEADWTHWLFRYVVSNDGQAMIDLLRHLGALPDVDEMGALAGLLAGYAGPGTASGAAYDAVARRLAGRPRDVLALEVFRLHDRIASDPEHVRDADVQAGLALAEQLGEPGVRAYFLALDAQVLHRQGDIGDAKLRLVEAMGILLALTQSDAVYAGRLMDVAQNTVAFAAMDGDLGTAKAAARLLDQLGAADRLGPMKDRLLA